MKKTLFYANIDCSDIGYTRKIEGMCNAFNNNGFDVKLLIKRKNPVNNTCNYRNVVYSKNTITSYIKFFYLTLFSKYKLIYVRHPRLNFIYIFILLCARFTNKKSSIVHEIPTYPYDHEWESDSLIDLMKKNMDAKCRAYLKFAVDTVTIIGGTSKNKVFGVKDVVI